jgi:hypothetical protein
MEKHYPPETTEQQRRLLELKAHLRTYNKPVTKIAKEKELNYRTLAAILQGTRPITDKMKAYYEEKFGIVL